MFRRYFNQCLELVFQNAKPTIGLEDNIKIDLKQIGRDGADCVDLGQDGDKWWANWERGKIMYCNFAFHKTWIIFFYWMRNY